MARGLLVLKIFLERGATFIFSTKYDTCGVADLQNIFIHTVRPDNYCKNVNVCEILMSPPQWRNIRNFRELLNGRHNYGGLCGIRNVEYLNDGNVAASMDL